MASLNRYKYKFSFVMPVYNVEQYLDETVQSVLNQSMDFEQNCEIIFINDGSPDNVEKICLKYKKLYPNNIKYIKQENQGVSAARNRGLKDTEGKYISFLDSDDKISRGTLKKVYNFLEKHYNEVDLCSIKLVFFDAKAGDHPLNYKYTKTRVVSLVDDFDYVQLSGSSAFVKSEAIDQSVGFNTKLQTAEDATFLTQLLMNGKMAYGVITGPTYFYRKRSTPGSAISGSLSNPSWYLDTTEFAYKFMLDEAEKKFGQIPKYVQFLVMYDLQWRLRQTTQNALSAKGLKRYKSAIANLLKRIDDSIIMAQHSLFTEHKVLALELKYGHDVLATTKTTSGTVSYKDIEIYDYNVNRYMVVIDTFTLKNGQLHIEGYFRGLIVKGASLELHCDGVVRFCQWREVKYRQFYWLDTPMNSGNSFSVDIDAKAGSDIYFELDDGYDHYRVDISYRMFSRLNPVARWSYRVIGDNFLRKESATALRLYRRTVFNATKLEIIYLFGLLIRLKLDRIKVSLKSLIRGNLSVAKDILAIPIKSLLKNSYSILVRLVYYVYRPFAPKNIWLISDRLISAGDNGEAFFRYLVQTKPKDISYLFVIEKSSSDYSRLIELGKVVDRGSFYYKLLFLCSSKIISSQAEHNIFNAFGHLWTDFVDLYKFKFVFLQHGIIYNDLSAWLNRQNKNIDMFVTSATPEYESILKGDYDYDEKVVKLTGLPRYDSLRNTPKNKIIIAPTWRTQLVPPMDQSTGRRDYSSSFRGSEYFKFYQNLINDKRILKAVSEHELSVEFYLHPSHARQIRDFSTNSSGVHIMQVPYDYKKAFSEGDLLVTDYSSVAFDFVYLGKPVIYSQFDKKEFFEGQMYDMGYFSYEKDGFGPVINDYERTVKSILESIESGFEFLPKYQKRIAKFYAFHDKNNSKRVYEAILSLDES